MLMTGMPDNFWQRVRASQHSHQPEDVLRWLWAPPGGDAGGGWGADRLQSQDAGA